jgi:hypothetical protein
MLFDDDDKPKTTRFVVAYEVKPQIDRRELGKLTQCALNAPGCALAHLCPGGFDFGL